MMPMLDEAPTLQGVRYRPKARSWMLVTPEAIKVRGRGHLARHNEAREYWRRSVKRYLAEGGVSPAVALRASRTLAPLMSNNFVFPHLSVDSDGEFNALWLAGRASLEISVPKTGKLYVRATDHAGQETFMGFFSALPHSQVLSQLDSITKSVTTANPDWRKIFQQ